MGFSLLISIETTHAACMRSQYAANIVSTTQDEAAEKLQTGNLLWSSIPDEYAAYGLKPVRWRQAQEELAFHEPPHTSSIVSKPGTSAIRGGKKDMYYDEAAFIKEFPKLWQAGLPAIVRGAGRVTVVSTPMGESGLYYELWNAEGWTRHEVPWWHSRFMVRGEHYEAVAEAMELAPMMSTEERIERFGSDKLKHIFHVGLRGDIIAFKTEFECTFIDELEAFYPYKLIRDNVNSSLRIWKTMPSEWNEEYNRTIGVDLAKKRDSTVFTVVEHRPDKKRILFFQESQDDYDTQFEQLRRLAEVVKPVRISIDETGVGASFVERAKKGELGIPSLRIEGVMFNNSKKENWATTFKGDLQSDKIEYPDHPEFISQVHGIKRTRTENGLFKFAGEKDDYFWSSMLALYGENRVPVRFYQLG